MLSFPRKSPQKYAFIFTFPNPSSRHNGTKKSPSLFFYPQSLGDSPRERWGSYSPDPLGRYAPLSGLFTPGGIPYILYKCALKQNILSRNVTAAERMMSGQIFFKSKSCVSRFYPLPLRLFLVCSAVWGGQEPYHADRTEDKR